MDQNELRFENTRLFEDTQINSFGFAVPGSRLPSFGLSVVSLSSGSFQRTDDMNDPLGTFREGETAYLFTMSKGFGTRFALGTNLRLVRQTVEDFSGGGFGVDLGGWYDLTPTLRLGASAANLGGPSITLRGSQENYPQQFRAGAALHLLDGRGLVTAELDQSQGLGAKFHGGAEYWIQSMFAVRVGYDETDATGGLSYRLGPAYQIDYGVVNQALGLSHRVGLSYRFGGFFASSNAEPAVFSPTGDRAVTQIALNSHTKGEPDRWTLEIVNKSDQVVRSFSGAGQPPAHVEWDGKDANGLPMADGNYRYRLMVKDHDGRQVAASSREVRISTGGPQGNVPMVPIGGNVDQPK